MTREKPAAGMKRGGRGSTNACPSYVYSRVTLYHASKIDLRYCRTLHSCGACKLGQVEDPCGAIHYGICAAVPMPSAKLRRSSSASTIGSSPSLPSSPVPSSPGSPSGKSPSGSVIYHSSANFASPTSPTTKDAPQSRSLEILREGHELAGTRLDGRPTVQQAGVIRLQPQRQVIVQGKKNQGSGGVAIAIQHGQTTITSGGNANIKIQGQGHEIHIQGSGGQNIRYHPTVGAGGRMGHVIRIQGQGQPQTGLVQYPGHSQQFVQSLPSPPLVVDEVDATPTPPFPVPKSYSSTKHIIPHKPTARVAPAPVPLPVPAPAPTVISEAILSPPLVVSPSPSPDPTSPSPGQTPPFPVCSPINSSPGTPTSSPSPRQTSPESLIPASTIKQPVISVNNKDKEISNHVSPTSPTTPTSTADIIKSRQGGGVKDVPSHSSGEGLLLHPANEAYPNNRKLQAKDGDSHLQQPQHPHARLQGHKDAGEFKIINKMGGDGRESNKENKSKKRSSRPVSNVHIPQFYFPMGKPSPSQELETVLQRVAQEFAGLEGGKAYKQQMGAITKACGLPMYWKILLFRAAGGTSDDFITYQSLSVLLKKLYQTCNDEASKFLRLAAKPGATSLEFEDFEPLVQDVVETHPGLTFLQDAPEFHSRYVTTVISRIMFCVNRTWTGRITLPEIRKSNFLPTLLRLEEEEDINQIKDYFSYEHFYVIYCKFWELDKDHDLYIDKNDLSRHNDHALNSRLIDRIFSGAVTRGPDFQEGRMSYKEFVWFLLAEEDKKHPTSIEYWFRCMDLDGDGVVSMYEMEYFHEEQMNKMDTLCIERLPFEDTVCQMMDMVSPRMEGKITLGDLKACKMTNIFFDTFFNLDKFLEHEQRDPFANARDPNAEHVEVSDWNRYAEEEYDILVADEGNADMDEGNYEDDFEPEDDDELLREEMLRMAESTPVRGAKPGQSHTAEDIYDFSSTSNLGY